MIDINTLLRNFKMACLGGAKVPHSMSNPVIRVEDGKPVAAVFVYVYKKENLVEKKMPRPFSWIIADLETGEVITEYKCSEKDFTTASFGSLYDLNDPDKKIPTKEDFQRIYGLFDSLRAQCIEKGVCTLEMEEEYLNSVLEVTPSSYRIFYKDLTGLYK
jgi:hypothetical protein